MTAYRDCDRRAERARLHRIIRWCRALLAALVLLAVLLPGQAQAYPKNCRYIPHGQICTNSVTGRPSGRCDRGYQQMADLSCEPLPDRPWAPWGVP